MIDRAKYYGSLLHPAIARAYLTLPRRTVPEPSQSLDEAIRWICRAQDASGDGGVARSYSLAIHPFFGRRGWIPSYPETTGYIIPTMFDYAARTGHDEFFSRAVRMADWETDVQLPSGAVMGGTVDTHPTPAVFNTGQVIFGWTRAFLETRNERYLASAIRAADFLLSVQDADGAWRKSLSNYASRNIASYTYNARTAWGLLTVAQVTGRSSYREAAARNIEYALTRRHENGWLEDNCLSDPAHPLLHTIAYALRGILEAGITLNEPRYIAAARSGADALLERQRPDGSLAGRFDAEWNAVISHSCLTGNVQMGTVWARLFEVTGDVKYLDALGKANRFTQSVQWRGTGDPGLDGGISGSYPLHGRYGRFEVLNWAVKFFADSLMMEAAARARIHEPTPIAC